VAVGGSNEVQCQISALQSVLMFVNLIIVRADEVVFDQGYHTGVGNDLKVFPSNHFFHSRYRGGKIGVLVVQYDIFDMFHTADTVDFCNDSIELQHRARIYKNRGFCIVNEVGVALERVIGKIHAHPPDMIVYFNWLCKIHRAIIVKSDYFLQSIWHFNLETTGILKNGRLNLSYV